LYLFNGIDQLSNKLSDEGVEERDGLVVFPIDKIKSIVGEVIKDVVTIVGSNYVGTYTYNTSIITNVPMANNIYTENVVTTQSALITFSVYKLTNGKLRMCVNTEGAMFSNRTYGALVANFMAVIDMIGRPLVK
jgi:hypothetical protein